tara:strand:- start:56 stop:319 length:264 start_codon:yes stop_codon:yes gene_type:complete
VVIEFDAGLLAGLIQLTLQYRDWKTIIDFNNLTAFTDLFWIRKTNFFRRDTIFSKCWSKNDIAKIGDVVALADRLRNTNEFGVMFGN